MNQLSLLTRRVAAAVVGAVALAGAVACQSDKSSSPAAALSGPSVRREITDATTSITVDTTSAADTSADSTVRVDALKRIVPLPHDITAAGNIGRNGGYIGIPEAGVWLYVPKGVIRDREGVNFTITAKAGYAVAYDFGPAGSVFSDYVVIVQDLIPTGWVGMTDKTALKGGYFKSDAQLDSRRGKADVSEFVATDVDLRHARALVYVNHFSGYVIATGWR